MIRCPGGGSAAVRAAVTRDLQMELPGTVTGVGGLIMVDEAERGRARRVRHASRTQGMVGLGVVGRSPSATSRVEDARDDAA